MYQIADSLRVGRSLFATRSIPMGTHILSDSDCLIRFNPDKLAPLDDLLASTASESEEDQAQGWYAPLSGADFIKRYKSLPALALAAVAVINASSSQSQQEEQGEGESTERKTKILTMWKHIREMHCPSLPISQDTLLLIESCRELLRRGSASDQVAKCWNTCLDGGAAGGAEADDEADADTAAVRTEACAVSAIVHTVMAMKTNCHRSTDGLWCLFPLASKLAHSCDPNCYFVGPSPDNGFTASFVAMRDIGPREVLSFSYFGGPSLHLSTFQRRYRLLRSHLFVCRCERCDDTEDLSAAVVAPCKKQGCGASLLVRLSCPLGMPDADAPMAASWRCTVCQSRCRDTDLPAAVQALRLQSKGAIESPEQSAVKIFFEGAKLKYKTIATAVRRAATDPVTQRVVGDSLLSEACRQATIYFTTMCNISLKAPMFGAKPAASSASKSASADEGEVKVSPFQLLFSWAMRYFRCLDASGIIKQTKVDSPPHMLIMATAMQLIDVSLTGGNTSVDVQLAKEATQGTGILAVLARHVRPVVEATSRVQHGGATSNTNSNETAAAKRKLEKVKILCELEWEMEQVSSESLYEVLCMACSDEWREMSCGRKSQMPMSAKEARELQELEARGGLDAGFEKLLLAWAV